nr:MAG TPA: hypothetical protein [Caudoviricetes sp.]
MSVYLDRALFRHTNRHTFFVQNNNKKGVCFALIPTIGISTGKTPAAQHGGRGLNVGGCLGGVSPQNFQKTKRGSNWHE